MLFEIKEHPECYVYILQVHSLYNCYYWVSQTFSTMLVKECPPTHYLSEYCH
jgi:hypothetical protein